jgi:hypothetical protein
MTPGNTEFDTVWGLFNQAGKDILGSPEAWLEEAHRPHPQRLLWPLPAPKKNGEKLAYWLGQVAVEHTLAAIREAHGEEAVPQDVNGEDFQLVLRMAARVVDRVYDEARAKFGPGVLQGKQDFMNRMRAAAVKEANKPGQKRQLFAAMKISKSAAYRFEKKSRAKAA